MQKFFILEGAYLVIALFVLAITLFVSTRPFMQRGTYKKALFWVGSSVFLMIGAHYWITTSRMAGVKDAFMANKPVLCESRMQRKVAQSVEILRTREWSLQGDLFVSPHYSRPFHTARCIVK